MWRQLRTQFSFDTRFLFPTLRENQLNIVFVSKFCTWLWFSILASLMKAPVHHFQGNWLSLCKVIQASASVANTVRVTIWCGAYLYLTWNQTFIIKCNRTKIVRYRSWKNEMPRQNHKRNHQSKKITVCNRQIREQIPCKQKLPLAVCVFPNEMHNSLTYVERNCPTLRVVLHAFILPFHFSKTVHRQKTCPSSTQFSFTEVHSFRFREFQELTFCFVL